MLDGGHANPYTNTHGLDGENTIAPFIDDNRCAMIPQDISPLATRRVPTNEHELLVRATTAQDARESGVIGVPIADKPCSTVSNPLTMRRKGVIRKTDRCNLLGRSNLPVRRMRIASGLGSGLVASHHTLASLDP